MTRIILEFDVNQFIEIYRIYSYPMQMFIRIFVGYDLILKYLLYKMSNFNYLYFYFTAPNKA